MEKNFKMKNKGKNQIKKMKMMKIKENKTK
jgi:hypothetical protein